MDRSDKQLSVVLFREDLRTNDHDALFEAGTKGFVVPLYIWDPASYGNWPLGAASRYWLKGALRRLNASLEKLGSKLMLRAGDTRQQLDEVRRLQRFTHLYISQGIDPFARAWAKQIELWCERNDVVFVHRPGTTLCHPESLKNKAGSFYKVFTPFWNQLQEQLEPAAVRNIKTLATPKLTGLSTISPEAVDDADGCGWQEQLTLFWKDQPRTAQATLGQFLKADISDYQERRDLLSTAGTSQLSPFLRFGEISPQSVWRDTEHQAGDRGTPFLRQLAWREFAYHLLWHCPETIEQPLRKEFARYPWETRPNAKFIAWTRGQTGVPLIDAGMQELWQTGIMHNRVRMIVASFLVKHLHISWQLGARWFWDTLVDADLANNTMGWQWVAGCGADASPFFRIFNPMTQAKKFDPEGHYRSRWLVDQSAPESPIVDLAEERKNALDRYRRAIVEARS